uniref:FAD-dependent oxidoreductase n=1 Tax=Paractinoplanes polyasparticus TaxID=2856853 RepID=UPI001C855C7B|nr:hypothetical protein [Actinoplanes polyasparticus]
MAGLLAARVLSERFERITVVERDRLPDGPEGRPGVPQGAHVHALLALGGRILDELFPDLLDRMAADGVPQSFGGPHYWADFGGRTLSRGGGLHEKPILLASRPYLEGQIRRLVGGLPSVEIRDNCVALGLTVGPSGEEVTAVRVVPADEDEQNLAADLVVDATGRDGRTPVWLRELGFPAPEVSEVVIDLRYVSRAVRLRPGALGDVKVVLVAPVPGRPSGLGLFEQEGGHHLLSVAGYAGNHPPTDLDEFVTFAEKFAPHFVGTALRDAEWLGAPHRHRFPTGRRRHYERLRRFPRGLLVIGDGICSLNPLFGQGMTVAALEALALRDAVAVGGPDLAVRFFASAAELVDPAWQMATSVDRKVLGLPRSSVERAFGAYVDRLHAAAESDAVLSERVQAVAEMLEPPSTFLKPTVTLRVLAGLLRRR